MSAILHSIVTSIENDRISDHLKNWFEMAGLRFRREHKVKFAPTLKVLNVWADFYSQCEERDEIEELSEFEYQVHHPAHTPPHKFIWTINGNWWVGDDLVTFDDHKKHVLFYKTPNVDGSTSIYLDGGLDGIVGEDGSSWFKVNDFTEIDPAIHWQWFIDVLDHKRYHHYERWSDEWWEQINSILVETSYDNHHIGHN